MTAPIAADQESDFAVPPDDRFAPIVLKNSPVEAEGVR
jgi:hypothetical protein